MAYTNDFYYDNQDLLKVEEGDAGLCDYDGSIGYRSFVYWQWFHQYA